MTNNDPPPLKELQGLIDEANQSLEESGTPSHEIMVIVLHREFTAGSIGITLAGGADYENKDITVRWHSVWIILPFSCALKK